MRGVFIRWLILTAAILLAAYTFAGIQVSGFFSAFFAAAVLGILNAFLRPILILLTLPLNILTLGLFTFIINALLLMMASGVITGFEIQSFGYALLGALMIGLVNWALSSLINERGQITYVEMHRRRDGRWE